MPDFKVYICPACETLSTENFFIESKKGWVCEECGQLHPTKLDDLYATVMTSGAVLDLPHYLREMEYHLDKFIQDKLAGREVYQTLSKRGFLVYEIDCWIALPEQLEDYGYWKDKAFIIPWGLRKDEDEKRELWDVLIRCGLMPIHAEVLRKCEPAWIKIVPSQVWDR